MRFTTRAAMAAASLACVVAAGTPGPANGAGVALSDARVAPDHIRVLKPGATATAGVCPDEATDVQAYSGTGGALGAQGTYREHGRLLFHYWQDTRSGEYVYLSCGIKGRPGQWINNTPRPVLVATWCA